MLADKKLRLSYIVILPQTKTHVAWRLTRQDCHISLFYIKPQPTIEKDAVFGVVIYRYSTSNHNYLYTHCGIYRLSYIVILHQTTTKIVITMNPNMLSYIVILHQTTTTTVSVFSTLLLSYIVILHQTTTRWFIRPFHLCCHISLFYIKPQLTRRCEFLGSCCHISFFRFWVSWVRLSYIVILHQTTTAIDRILMLISCHISLFYIKPQLFLALNWKLSGCHISLFYIKPQHEIGMYDAQTRCHISLFYIKPQLNLLVMWIDLVVIYRYSTSNHNYLILIKILYIVVIYRYSTSNHNLIYMLLRSTLLSYIVILHQTTTIRVNIIY